MTPIGLHKKYKGEMKQIQPNIFPKIQQIPYDEQEKFLAFSFPDEDIEDFQQCAVDAGFDYVSFPSLQPEDQVKSLPECFLSEIEVKQNETFFSHNHELKQHSPKHHTAWRCDKIKGVANCLSKDIVKY